MITIDHQIAEVRRELALRSRVFPGFIARGKMRESEAALHIARMKAVLQTLEWVQKNAAVIKDQTEAYVDEPQPGWVAR